MSKLAALAYLGLLSTACAMADPLPDLADYEPAEIWELADLAGEDGVVNGFIGGEELIEAPFSGTPCYLCRYRLTVQRDAPEFHWGNESAGPVYILAGGLMFPLGFMALEWRPGFSETHPPGEEPVEWREAYFPERTSDVESVTWDEWRLEPGREYRFEVTELHGWYEGEVGHSIEWQLSCLGPVDQKETDE